MQMAYAAEEDRILFRINSTQKQEFRFWVTRRYAMLLLKVLQSHRVADPDVSTQVSAEDRQVVQDFKKEQAIEEANFEQKFEDDASEYPLGEAAKLAFKLSYSIKSDGNLQISVEPKEGQGINIAIHQQLNITLSELLLTAARKGDWKLDEWFQTLSASPSQERVVN